MAELKYSGINKVEKISEADGLCKGIAMMATQAIVIGQFQEFKDRINVIKRKDVQGVIKLIQTAEKLRQIEQSTLTPEQRKKITRADELLSFFDGVALYANPFTYEHLFEAPFPSQLNEKKISKVVQSKQLDETTKGDGLVKIPLVCNAYTQEELSNYLDRLGKELTKGDCDNIAISVESINHAITIRYNKTNGWTLIDANNLDKDFTFANPAAAANCIRRMFKVEKNEENLILSTNMFAAKNDAEFFYGFKDLIEKQSNQAIKSKENILFTALQGGYTNVAKGLINSGRYDINQAVRNNLTPLYLAATKGHIEIVQALLGTGKCKVNQATGEGATPLHIAAQSGYVEIVQALLNTKECDVNQTTKTGATPLYLAVINGHIKIALELLNTGKCDVNQATEKNRVLLDIAIQKGYLAVVEALIKAGVTVAEPQKLWSTMLFNTVKNGAMTIVDALIKNGANINEQDANGETPLFIAAKNGYLNAVQVLLNTGKCDLLQKIKMSPLHVAAQNGHLAVVEALIKAGVTVTEPQKLWSAMLFNAAKKGDAAVIGSLINNGANIYEEHGKGETPLSIAVQNGKIAVVAAMIKADPKIAVPQIWSTMLVQAIENNNIAIISALIKKGANVDAKDENGKPPLFIAAQNGNLAIVEALINEGADIGAEDKSGNTALHTAVAADALEVVKTLVKEGSKVDQKNNHGVSPLSMAEEDGEEEMVQALKYKEIQLVKAVEAGDLRKAEHFLNMGANINEENMEGFTPLSIAIIKDNLAMVKALIAAGADINKPDTRGITPLDMAKDTRLVEIIKVLIEAGAKAEQCSANTKKPPQTNTQIPFPSMFPQEMNSTKLKELIGPEHKQKPKQEQEPGQKKDKGERDCTIF